MDASREAFLEYLKSHLQDSTVESLDILINRLTKSGYQLEQLQNLTTDELTEVIVDLQPNSVRMTTQFIHVIGSYFRFLQDDKAIDALNSISRKDLWSKCRQVNPVKKFISKEEFEDLLFNIETTEELNVLFNVSLLSVIFEGIYSEDMSVINNLRASDIHENCVTVRNDNGETYPLFISSKLSDEIQELSLTQTVERRNRFNYFTIPVYGQFPDSVFKLENRESGTNYRFSYFSRFRKISKDYLDFSLKPRYLFISGMMSRIKEQLEQNGMTLQFAFIDSPMNRVACDIIQAELDRCHYSSDRNNLREIVNGFISDF